MSKVTVMTDLLTVGRQLVDEIPEGPWPADDLEELRRSAMHLTAVVLYRFPEIR